VIKILLELFHCLRTLLGLKIGQTTQIGRYANGDVAELLGLRGAQFFDRFGAIATLQLHSSAI
jgi:hypothetical protein